MGEVEDEGDGVGDECERREKVIRGVKGWVCGVEYVVEIVVEEV